VAWNTVLAAPADVIQVASHEAELTGDTLSGHTAREPDPVPGLDEALEADRRAAWAELRALAP
jgi:hypothetical protein